MLGAILLIKLSFITLIVLKLGILILRVICSIIMQIVIMLTVVGECD